MKKKRFKVKDIKKYNVGELYQYRHISALEQGEDENFSQMIDNRINMINGALIKKGEKV